MDIESNSKESEKMVAEISPLLKFVLELGPLMVFFFANSRGEWLASTFPVLTEFGGPIFIATGLFMIATAVALSVSWVLTRKLPIMPLISGIVVFVFGAILLGGLLFGKSLLGYVFHAAFKLTDEGWRKLTLRWGVFFLFLAVLNEVVWRMFTTDTWVAFKVWGTMPITIIFTMAQMPLVMRHSLEPLNKDEK